MPPLPNFLVIGAQKSGTTWLHYFLADHPEVYVPSETKELMFFDRKDVFQDIGFEGYKRYFSGVQNEKAIGEVTPGYLWCSPKKPEWHRMSTFRVKTPLRVRNHLGENIKLIVVLRNPIDRALSGFLHHKRKRRIHPTDTLDNNLETRGIVHMGFYSLHLARWASVIAKENFFVITYDELFQSAQIRQRLLQFLGVNPDYYPDTLNTFYNKGVGFTRTEDDTYDSNGRLIASAETIAHLQEVYGPDVHDLRRTWLNSRDVWIEDFPRLAVPSATDPT